MSRVPVSLREVTPGDVGFLVELWGELLRRAEVEEQTAELDTIVATVIASVQDRIVIAEYDGECAGAVFLRVQATMPLSLEQAVQVIAPHVAPAFRRKGVGRSLMDVAVAYAEELGIGHVSTAVQNGHRDGNRFMARLGLGPLATTRIGTTHAVRSKLTAQLPARQRGAGRPQLGQVLAARRRTRSGGVALTREQGVGEP